MSDFIQNQQLVMSSIVENSPSFISYKKIGGECVYVNPSASKITGFTKEALLKDYIGLLFDKETGDRMAQTVLEALLRGEEAHFELPGRNAKGEARIYKGVSFLIEDGYFATIADDITKIRETENARNQLFNNFNYREEILQSLCKTAVAIISNDGETFSEVLSDALSPIAKAVDIERINVFKAKDASEKIGQVYSWQGKSLNIDERLETIPDMPDLNHLFNQLKQGIIVNTNIEQMSPELSEYLSHWNVKSIILVPVFTDDRFWGAVTLEDSKNVRLFSEDCYEIFRSLAYLVMGSYMRFEIDSKLKKALNEAVSGTKAKREFLSRISHEMRTPMNAIIGMLQVIKMREIPDKMLGNINSIETASGQLMALINDCLEVSNLDFGSMVLKEEMFNLQIAFLDVFDMIDESAKMKHQGFTYNIDVDVPHKVYADPKRIKQALLILLSNAVKFTQDGGIVMCNVGVMDENESSVLLNIEVSDNGIGIEKSLQPKLFDLFYQVDGGINRKHGGIGLGLSIVKEIAELMNGDIKLQSAVGKGSIFTLSLKLAKNEPQNR